MNLLLIVTGVAAILVGLFTDAGYGWFTTRFQRVFMGPTARKVMTVVSGIAMIVLGLVIQF